MRFLAAALIAIVASSPLSARAAGDWFQIGTSKGCRFYSMKQDFSGRFRNYLSKSDGSACPDLWRGIVFTKMADCEGFRFRDYDSESRIWGKWDAEVPAGSLIQDEIKYICT